MAATKKKLSADIDGGKSNDTEAVVEYSAENHTRYPVEKLRLNCIHLFGITKSTFDGAFFDAEKKEYTIDEARSLIDEWLYGKGGKR